MNHHHDLNVHVKYSASPKPFIAHHTPATETVGALLEKVLRAFGLSQGETVYNLRFEGNILENLNQTLGHIARCHHEESLHLTLGHQLVSG